MKPDEDDVEIANSASGSCTPLRGTLFALAGMIAAMLILGLALAHS